MNNQKTGKAEQTSSFWKDRIAAIAVSALSLCLLFWLSFYIANFTSTTDFPVFYSTAKTVLEKGVSSDLIYSIDSSFRSDIPEQHDPAASFIYSKAAAVVLSPLGALPYYPAKAVMIFLNMIAYLVGIRIVLNLFGLGAKKLMVVWGASFFWPPFIHVIRQSQVDGILFLLLAGAIFYASRKNCAAAGSLLGAAMLFKIFPLALAMLLAVRERKILAWCLAVFFASFIIPSSFDWFSAIPSVHPRAWSSLYLFWEGKSVFLYVAYSIFVGGVTAAIAFKAKDLSLVQIYVISLPAIYLTMPVVEYGHLTSLAITILYVLSKAASVNKAQVIAAIFTTIVLLVSVKERHWGPTFAGLFLVWVSMVLRNIRYTAFLGLFSKRLSQ